MMKSTQSFQAQNSSFCVIDRLSKNNKIGTGILNLDEFLGGGIYRGKSLVYCVQPGVEGDIFGMQTLFNTLKNGGYGVFIASNGSPRNLMVKFNELGWNIDYFFKKLIFVDDFNPLIGAPSEEKYVVSNPEKIEELNKTLINLFKELPASTIVFESLSTIMDLCGEKETIEAIRTWNKMAKLYNHIIIYNFTAWPYSCETMDLITDELFNAVIYMDGMTEGMIIGNDFKILKLDWEKEMKENIDIESGINRFIPESVPVTEKVPCLQCKIEEPDLRITGGKETFGWHDIKY